MEKIIAQVKSWELLSKLPLELESFTLAMELEERGTQYCIFTYENKECHKSFSVIYDKATKEFLARIVVGLMEYFDVNFIVADMKILEKLLIKRLKDTLKNLAVFNQDNLDSILIEKKILEWTYSENLPQEIAGFSLFIRPSQPVKIINGSYIILDYSDFSNESNLVIYYNIFRDEFFGEVRLHRTPQMSGVFDGNTLDKLQENIDIHLTKILENMRIQLAKDDLHK
ncbi:hypothetical protein [Pelosinus sp. sgz500959]|uniref:hypothetical protein n=1 Tax=Pelosinus sp. sgz500959 TaxID=3242472 RepID=UPI00367224D5